MAGVDEGGKTKVVYAMGTGRTGSTILGLTLCERSLLTALIELPCSAAFSMMRTAARSSLAAGAEPA